MIIKFVFFLLRPVLPILLVLFYLRKLYIKKLIFGFWLCLTAGIYSFFTEGNYRIIIIALCIGILPFLCFIFEKILYRDEELIKKRNGIILENKLTENEDDIEDSNDDSEQEKNSLYILLSYITPFWLYCLIYGIYDYQKHKNIIVLVAAIVLFITDNILTSTKNNKKWNK